MHNLYIFIALLAIEHSILFWGKDLGISVILFIIPLLIFLIYVLKKQNLVKNKYGLLFIIPIILLTCTYFIFNNTFFGTLNLLIIPLLFILMYIMTIKPTDKIAKIIEDTFSLIFRPINYLGNICHEIASYFKAKLKLSDKMVKIIKSIIIIFPILVIVLILLASADMIFNNIFSTIFKSIENALENFNLSNVFWRVTNIIILFFYLSVVFYFITNHYHKENSTNKPIKKRDDFTIKLLLTVLNIVYIIFDFIQIKSLMLHSVSETINYAEYARQGFFQLMFVSIINITIILISKKGEKDKNKYINIMSLVMVFLTFIIIVSSFLRMNLYEQEYGYTLMRLLVYITLFTEVILLLPTIRYILNPSTKITRNYIIVIVSIYTLINFINLDAIIAQKNINRYYLNSKIDIKYLENYDTGNILNLMDLYKKTNNKNIKKELDWYFSNLDTSINGFQEYNISKSIANKLIKNNS